MEITKDNYDLLMMQEAEMEAELESELDELPICECCGEPIQQAEAIYYNDQWCCEECEDVFWKGIRFDFLESTK